MSASMICHHARNVSMKPYTKLIVVRIELSRNGRVTTSSRLQIFYYVVVLAVNLVDGVGQLGSRLSMF